MGSRPLRMKVRWGCSPRVLSPPPHRTQSWRPCLPGQPWASGWRSKDRPVPSPRGWTIGFSERGAAHNRTLPRCLSSRRCMRSWRVCGWPLSRPEAARPPPPSSLPSTAEWPGGTRAFPRWRERSLCTCAHETPPLGGTVRVSRPRPVSWQPLSRPKVTVLRARQPPPCTPWLSCRFTKPRHSNRCTRVVPTRGWWRSCARRLTSLYEWRKSLRGPSGRRCPPWWSRSAMAVQGPPLRALPVSPCAHEGCRGCPYPVTGSGRQDPQLPRRLAYSSPIQRAVGWSQGLGAPAPQPVGASGQLGKEQALPCAENLFSRCGVRLGEYDGTPHGGTCPSSAELPEFLQRQECGTTETVSEAPGAYGIRSCSHAARIASYETTSALATLPGPEVGMAPRYTASRYLPAVSPLPQPLDRPCLSMGRGAPRTSVPAYCCHNRCLQHGLGRYMQRAGSLGALDRAPAALAHQLPGAVGSAFSLAASPHGQHCGGLVYQPAGVTVGWYTACHSSPAISSSGVTRISSHCVLFTSRGSSIVRPTRSHDSSRSPESGDSIPRRSGWSGVDSGKPKFGQIFNTYTGIIM